MVVRREYRDIVLFDDMPGLEIGDRHVDTQLSCFVTAGNNAAIIVAEHGNRLVTQIGTKHPLAAAIKTVTIDDSSHKLWITYVTTPQIENSDPERSTSIGERRAVSGTRRILLNVFSSRRISISP